MKSNLAIVFGSVGALGLAAAFALEFFLSRRRRR